MGLQKKRKLPTLLIMPQDGVQEQWVQSLVDAGVQHARIRIIGEKKSAAKKRRGPTKDTNTSGGEYILCTRYKIQSELKRLFECTTIDQLQSKGSILFRNVPLATLKKLKNQYHAANGNERNQFIQRHKKEPREDCVTRLVRESFNGKDSLGHAFETVVIDECHFLRNVLSYWGLGAACIGAQVSMTGVGKLSLLFWY